MLWILIIILVAIISIWFFMNNHKNISEVNSKNYRSPIEGDNNILLPMIYRNGPLLETPSIFLIWYGYWEESDKVIIRDFLYGINGSDYLKINSLYSTDLYKISGKFNFVPLENEINDNYSHGKKITDKNILDIVRKNSDGNPETIYFVMGGEDVMEISGYCHRYCGWHSFFETLKYSFIANPRTCMDQCSVQTNGPNKGNIDAMLSVLTHELSETITDPNFDGWYDSKGLENSDKCAWTYGELQKRGNYFFNLTLPSQNGTRDYLIQRIFNPESRTCVMK